MPLSTVHYCMIGKMSRRTTFILTRRENEENDLHVISGNIALIINNVTPEDAEKLATFFGNTKGKPGRTR